MERSLEEMNNLKAANNEVMRKIGRNMLLLQQLEGLLKYLLANSFFEGTPSTIKENREKYVSQIGKRSLGQLVSEFCDRSLVKDDDSQREQPEKACDEIQIGFRFSIECDQDGFESRKKVLADIVEERNNLIHHLLPTYNAESLEDLTRLEHQLDDQRAKVLKEIDYLSGIIKRFNDVRKQLSDFIESPEGKRFFVEGLLPGESRLERLLAELASLAARSDGWTPLVRAGQLVRELNAERLTQALEEQGLSSLKGLKKHIESSDRFELMEESVIKGSQWLYRPKSTHEELTHECR